MTTKRAFECNLCRDAIDADVHGYGIVFSSGRIELKNLAASESHLCTDCGSHLISAFTRDEPAPVPNLGERQIKHMVDRFLNWKLPKNFSPDAGITFKAEYNEHTAYPARHEPSGTNLLDATQATSMVRHMIEDLPQ